MKTRYSVLKHADIVVHGTIVPNMYYFINTYNRKAEGHKTILLTCSKTQLPALKTEQQEVRAMIGCGFIQVYHFQ